jgi:probable HAF family extracellular repeat protein
MTKNMIIQKASLIFIGMSCCHAQMIMTDLGTLPGGTSPHTSRAVSADGTVVVGLSGLKAFRWTQSAGMVDLGTLGGTSSHARGVSADGSVIVGEARTAAGFIRGFRWTQAGGMVEIGTLGAGTTPFGVSADGSVVVGGSAVIGPGGGTRAFLWTQAGGIINLGTLSPGWSFARGVSADGLVVIGESVPDSGGGAGAAFRWTAATGMVDIGSLYGGVRTSAGATNSDGSVVVGLSTFAGDATKGHAFRWTQSTGMVSLGSLGGNSESSGANSVSADGNVIAGDSTLTPGQTRAYRWTQASGMIDLGTLGGTVSKTLGMSADGSVIVGESTNASGETRAFVYRRVMLDTQDWLGSVGGVHSILSTGLELTRTHLEGAHHRPLAELGRGRSFWATGDIAASSRSRDLITRSGEAGATFAPRNNILVGIGAGYGMQDQNLLNGGSARNAGQYLIGEVDLIQADGGIFSLLVSVGDWKNTSNRGYVTGGGVDFSHGETSLSSKAIRLRYDSPVLARVYETDLKAYVSYSHSKVRSDAYAETGGSFPGGFDAMEQTAKEGRLGFAATHAFGEKTKLRLSAEWIRRFDHDQSALSANDLAGTMGLSYSLPTADPVRDQVRIGLDIDYALDAQTTLSFTVHAAGRGEVADVSGAISLRKAF